MGRRTAVPLYKSRHAKFIQGCHDINDPAKGTASLLAVGTGPRNDTIGHTHADWFVYTDDSEALYYRIPASDGCRKDVDTAFCGECNGNDHEGYEPKTPAGAGRRILISNEWTNPVTREVEYLGLRDMIESYFALDGPNAPDGLQHGHEMFVAQGSAGISKTTLNEWVRKVAVEAGISAPLREDWLREAIDVEDPDDPDNDRKVEQIKDFGTDAAGNRIPDLMAHDLRSSYCTQLMRNDVSRHKAITKTGHANPDSMNPYVAFHEQEIDEQEEESFY